MILANNVFEVIVAIVMLFLGMAGWLGQQVKNKQQGAQPRPNRAQGGDARVQDEIERFLQEVTGQKPAQKQQRRPQRDRQNDPSQDYDEELHRRRQRADDAREEREQKQRREEYEREQAREADERRQAAERRRRESERASDRRSVANQPPKQRRPPKVKAKVASKPAGSETPIEVSVADVVPLAARPPGAHRPIGATRQTGTMTSVSHAAAAAIGGESSMPVTLSELRDPAAIKKAFILQEIFRRPRSLHGADDS